MNRLTAFFAWCALALMAGCAAPVAPTVVPRHGGTAQADGLELSVALSAASVKAGDKITVTVTARNVSDSPITIHADNSAPIWVRVWHETPMGWDVVRTYPRSVAKVQSSVKLAPGEARPFTMTLPVEPEWPTNERIRISGELNGNKLQAHADLLVERK